MLSRDRWDYSPTMSTMPDALKEYVTVMVPHDQLKQYQNSELFQHVKDIKAWIPFIDCVPKKRRYLYENVKGPYIVLDDDLGLVQWNTDTEKFDPLTKKPNLFMRRVERMWKDLECGSSMSVGAANTFMTSKRIKEQGKLWWPDQVPFCFAGYGAKRPKLQWNQFFFTDIAIPMQLMAMGHPVTTYAALAYNMRNNKKLQTTGTSVYRNEDVIKYSALALSRMMPGYVFGLKDTGNNGGGWSLQKTFTRPNRDRTNDWEAKFLAENGLNRVPLPVDLNLAKPKEDLFKAYASSWKTARKPRKAT
jgi:hypothetical protein